ncbi:hypothetical protein M3Y97_00921600 [Aphelenchoides bicaudatus]|nr:hypothetical protein M3Y97_00921600 [Aphelenchoides bicaudatus]
MGNMYSKKKRYRIVVHNQQPRRQFLELKNKEKPQDFSSLYKQPPRNPEYRSVDHVQSPQQPPRRTPNRHGMIMSVQSEDITVPWGGSPDPLDYQFGKWRQAVFQDMQESLDQNKLYFLYDPTADDQCITTGSRKSMTCIVVFDVHRKCFVAEIPLRIQGRAKMLFALNQPSSGGGTAFVVTSQSEDYGQYVLHVWRFELQNDGVTPVGDPRSLLNSPINIDVDFICSMRDDQPELVVIYVQLSPQPPTNRFSVSGAELSHFYDGFLSRGNVYFLSASPDGHLDYSRIHILSLQNQQLTTQFCQPDPQRGLPSARKQAALDSTSGFILLAGGEIDYGGGDVQRLVDYWVLDLNSFKWNQIQSQMSVPLIEPRLTTTNSGNVYVWGDFDDPLPNMQEGTTHVRILRVRGLNAFHPPSYGAPSGGGQAPYPANPSYPQQSGYGGQQPYGQNPYGQSSGQQYPQQGGIWRTKLSSAKLRRPTTRRLQCSSKLQPRCTSATSILSTAREKQELRHFLNQSTCNSSSKK